MTKSFCSLLFLLFLFFFFLFLINVNLMYLEHLRIKFLSDFYWDCTASQNLDMKYFISVMISSLINAFRSVLKFICYKNIYLFLFYNNSILVRVYILYDMYFLEFVEDYLVFVPPLFLKYDPRVSEKNGNSLVFRSKVLYMPFNQACWYILPSFRSAFPKNKMERYDETSSNEGGVSTYLYSSAIFFYF